MSENNRLIYLDAAKGFALLLVILGHAIRPSMVETFQWCKYAYDYIYSFHLALFFMISGICYALTRNKYKSALFMIKRKAKQLLLPWAAYALVIYVIFTVVSSTPGLKNVLQGTKYAAMPIHEYLLLMIENENPYAFHLWYLQTLFLLTITAIALDRWKNVTASRYVRWILIVLLPLVYTFISGYWKRAVTGFCMEYPFFFLGIEFVSIRMDKHAGKLCVMAGISSVTMAAIVALSPAASPFEDAVERLWYFLQTIVSVSLCLGLLGVFYVFNTSWLAALGRKSLLIYLYHQPIGAAVVGLVLYDKMHLSAPIVIIVCYAACLLIPYVVSQLVRLLRLQKVFDLVHLPY